MQGPEGWHTDFVDDVYTLDVTSWRWTYRKPKLSAIDQLNGDGVVARAGHTATLLPGRKLLIFGRALQVQVHPSLTPA